MLLGETGVLGEIIEHKFNPSRERERERERKPRVAGLSNLVHATLQTHTKPGVKALNSILMKNKLSSANPPGSPQKRYLFVMGNEPYLTVSIYSIILTMLCII